MGLIINTSSVFAILAMRVYVQGGTILGVHDKLSFICQRIINFQTVDLAKQTTRITLWSLPTDKIYTETKFRISDK